MSDYESNFMATTKLSLLPQTGARLDELEKRLRKNFQYAGEAFEALLPLLPPKVADLVRKRHEYFKLKHQFAHIAPYAKQVWLKEELLPVLNSVATFQLHGALGGDPRAPHDYPRAICPLCNTQRQVLYHAKGFTRTGLMRHLTRLDNRQCPVVGLMSSIMEIEIAYLLDASSKMNSRKRVVVRVNRK